MTDSLIIKSPSAFSGGARAPQKPDPFARPGIMTLIDFTDPRCHPTGEIVPGAVLGGAIFKALAGSSEAKRKAVVSGASGSATPWTVNADGSLTSAGGSGLLQIGLGEGFNLGGSTDEFAFLMHAKLNTGFSTTNYIGLLGNAGSANGSSIYMDWGRGGNIPRSGTGTGSSSWTGAFPSAVAVGEVFHMGCYLNPQSTAGVTQRSYRNGVTLNTTGSTYTLPTTTSAQPLVISGAQKCTIYRMLVLNVTQAKAAEAEYWEDADILGAADTILRDYQFVTNALPAAPRTPFV